MKNPGGTFTRREFGALGLVLALGSRATSEDGTGLHPFSYDHVLGTSLDLLVAVADRGRAEACESAVLEEVERLRRILSTYDPSSEISRPSNVPIKMRKRQGWPGFALGSCQAETPREETSE